MGQDGPQGRDGEEGQNNRKREWKWMGKGGVGKARLDRKRVMETGDVG